MKLIEIVHLYRAKSAFQRFANQRIKDQIRAPFTPEEISEYRLSEIYG